MENSDTRKKKYKKSLLRKQSPSLPFFYNGNGEVYLCQCGKIADVVTARPSSLKLAATNCYDCWDMENTKK